GVKTSLDRVMNHGGERNLIRYAQLAEHMPQVGVHGVRREVQPLATAFLKRWSARVLPDHCGRPGRDARRSRGTRGGLPRQLAPTLSSLGRTRFLAVLAGRAPGLSLGSPLYLAGCPAVERLEGRCEVLPGLFALRIQAFDLEDPPVAHQRHDDVVVV